jgi:hypothetical protein
MVAPRSMVGPSADPAHSPMVTTGRWATSVATSTIPSTTTWPWGRYAPGWTTTGSPMASWPIITAKRWQTPGDYGMRQAWQAALAR